MQYFFMVYNNCSAGIHVEFSQKVGSKTLRTGDIPVSSCINYTLLKYRIIPTA